MHQESYSPFGEVPCYRAIRNDFTAVKPLLFLFCPKSTKMGGSKLQRLYTQLIWSSGKADFARKLPMFSCDDERPKVSPETSVSKQNITRYQTDNLPLRVPTKKMPDFEHTAPLQFFVLRACGSFVTTHRKQ